MSENNKNQCFVLLPFSNGTPEILDKAIRPACTEAGYAVTDARELAGAFRINDNIVSQALQSDVMIADLSGWDAAVFYLVGAIHARSNKVIMLIEKEQPIPFEVSNYHCIRYHDTEAGLHRLRLRLERALTAPQDWRSTTSNPIAENAVAEEEEPPAERPSFIQRRRRRNERLASRRG